MANQYSNVDKTEFSGWANRSTWCIQLWLDNDESYRMQYDNYVYFAAKGLDGYSWNDVKRNLYRRVWAYRAKADGCIWSHIDWAELRKHFDDAVAYQKANG